MGKDPVENNVERELNTAYIEEREKHDIKARRVNQRKVETVGREQTEENQRMKISCAEKQADRR